MKLLFIDPASISTGWCLTLDGRIIAHGTIAAIAKAPAHERLAHIRAQYEILEQIKGPFDAVHVERMNYKVHFLVQWAIGAIVSALGWNAPCDADISPKAWQKTVDWKGKRGPLQSYKDLVKSEDELAAVGMALHWKEIHNV